MPISIDNTFRPDPETGYEAYRKLHDYFYKRATAMALELARIEHEQQEPEVWYCLEEYYVGSDTISIELLVEYKHEVTAQYRFTKDLFFRDDWKREYLRRELNQPFVPTWIHDAFEDLEILL